MRLPSCRGRPRPLGTEGPATRVIAGAGTLNLDHVRAEIGPRLAGPWAGQDAGQVEHANVRECCRQLWSSCSDALDDDGEPLADADA